MNPTDKQPGATPDAPEGTSSSRGGCRACLGASRRGRPLSVFAKTRDVLRVALPGHPILLTNVLTAFGLLIPLAAQTPPAGDPPVADATITIHGTNRIGTASPLLFGAMMENWGNYGKQNDPRNGIYGSVWVGEDSSLPHVRGFRQDVLDAHRRLSPTILRWPGGSGCQTYHWKEGVGPQAGRVPARTWDPDLIEPHTFGTREFIEFCRQIGAEPYVNVNVGTGSAEEAADWVEYCNRSAMTVAGSSAPVKTRYAALREAHGSPAPFGVKYWGIGNELHEPYEVAQLTADEHARVVLAYSRLMRDANRDIQIVAVGHTEEWNRVLLQKAGHQIDFLSMHRYYHENDYHRLLACPLHLEAVVKSWRKVIDEPRPALPRNARPRRITVAIDEWNCWHWGLGSYHKSALTDGLFSAGMFHAFLRHCDIIGMANFCNTVNSDPCGMIVTDTNRLYINPMGLAFELYRHHTGNTVLDVETGVEGYDAGEVLGIPLHRVPYLDCVATTDASQRTLFVAVINRHRTQDIRTTVRIDALHVAPTAVVRELNAPEATTVNDLDSPNNVAVKQRPLEGAGRGFDYVFPAHSASIIELSLR